MRSDLGKNTKDIMKNFVKIPYFFVDKLKNHD